MTSSTPSPALDHIVILVPHETLQNLPPWLTGTFTLAPGGRHADGVTENKLILFQDGVYLELISFISNEKDKRGRQSHRWGARREGHIIDWANTLPHEADLAIIRARVAAARTGITYAAPQPGGRIRPDGVELRWVTCSPELSGQKAAEESASSVANPDFIGGEAPFWCLDRTPRALRVPYQGGQGESLVRHPSGVLGVSGVSVFVRDGRLFRMLKATYDALQGQAGHKFGEERGSSGDEGFSWDLHVPAVVGADREKTPRRTLSLVRMGEDDIAAGRGEVYVKLSLFTSASAGKIGGSLGDEKSDLEFDLVGPT